MKLYGLKNCDACKKAMKALDAAGRDFAFIDIRAEADLAKLAPKWLDAVGADALVNKRSTTWRGLGEAERAKSETPVGAAKLLAANPTLVKRPVIEQGGAVLVGWSDETKAALSA